MSNPSECDVTVIGAGIAGLTAAALLSKAGLRPVVIEAERQPGGYLVSFSRRGFTFDASLQWLNQCGPGGLVHRLYRHIGPEFPACPPLRRIRRYRGDSFDYLLTDNPLELRERLLGEMPADAAGIRRFFDDARALADRWAVLSTRFRTPHTMGFAERTRMGLKMLAWLVPMLPYLRTSAETALPRYFGDTRLCKIFGSETSLMAMLMPFAWAYLHDYQAPPTGGSQAMADWLVQQIEARGGRVMLGRRVAQVLVRSGAAAGVELDGGETIRSRFVIAACDAGELYERLLPPGLASDSLLRRLRGADLYASHFSVFLGLDCPTEQFGIGEEVTLLTRDDVPRGEQSNADPRKAAIGIVAPSVRDPSLAPAGKGTLTVHCQAGIRQHDEWRTEAGRTRGAAYRSFKEDFARTLVGRVEERLAPGLRSHIEYMDAATPITFWRYTANRDGSIMGATPSGRNIRRRVADYGTPVRRLLLGGHWAEYGGGVPVAIKAAANCSAIILRDTCPEAFAELCDVMDGRGG